MDFEYRVYDNVYTDILLGKKRIEFRLLNNKSNSIQIGDKITFFVINDRKKYIKVEVIDKIIYKDVDALWDSKDILSNTLDYTKEEFIDMFYNIFGRENVIHSKIIGFKFKIAT